MSALGYNDGNDGNGPGSAPGVAQTIGTKSNVHPCDDDRAARLELTIKKLTNANSDHGRTKGGAGSS
eukprot:7825516-Karenia_brevis.AAC.1